MISNARQAARSSENGGPEHEGRVTLPRVARSRVAIVFALAIALVGAGGFVAGSLIPRSQASQAFDDETPATVIADLRDLAQGVNSDLASNVLVISAVLLVLVCLTCSISMFLTVLARTREIALRRAVGATRRDIRILFLAEGFLLGLSGGLAGASLGIAATTVACLLLRWAPTFDPLGALVAVLVGTTAGALSSVIPARRAALIEPANALRGV